MSIRPAIQGRLEALDAMLAHWLAHVRHPAQFWPQFENLAAEILDHCTDSEREQVCALIEAMLKRHPLELPAWHQRGDDVPPGS